MQNYSLFLFLELIPHKHFEIPGKRSVKCSLSRSGGLAVNFWSDSSLSSMRQTHRVPVAVSSLPFCRLARVDGLLGLFLRSNKNKHETTVVALVLNLPLLSFNRMWQWWCLLGAPECKPSATKQLLHVFTRNPVNNNVWLVGPDTRHRLYILISIIVGGCCFFGSFVSLSC